MRFLLFASGTPFLASTGAFFLYIPPLSIATVVLILVGLTLMFGLGFQAGGHGMVPCEAAGNAVEFREDYAYPAPHPKCA